MNWTAYPDYSYNVFWREKWGLPVWQATGTGAGWVKSIGEGAKSNPSSVEAITGSPGGQVRSKRMTESQARAYLRAQWNKKADPDSWVMGFERRDGTGEMLFLAVGDRYPNWVPVGSAGSYSFRATLVT